MASEHNGDAVMMVSAGLLLLSACWWTPAPGPIPLDVAAQPVRAVSVKQTDPDAMVEIAVAAGSAMDPAGQSGLAWLTAHALRHGGAGERTPEEVNTLLANMGAEVEVVVEREVVVFRVRAPAEHLAGVVGLVGDMLVRPRLASASVESLVRTQRQALVDSEPNPGQSVGSTVLETLVFEGHPYGHPLRGRSGVVPTLGTDHVRAFWAERYVRGAVVLGHGSERQSEAGVIAALRDELSALPARLSGPVTPRRLPPNVGPDLLMMVTDDETDPAATLEKGVRVALGHAVNVGTTHADWPALAVGLSALEERVSGGQSHAEADNSRFLLGSVARRQPLVVFEPEVGNDEHLSAAVSRVRDVLETVQQDGIEQTEIDRARAELKGELQVWGADEGRGMTDAVMAAATGMPSPFKRLAEALPGITAVEVNSALQEHLDPGALRVVIVPDREAVVPQVLAQAAEVREPESVEQQPAEDSEIADVAAPDTAEVDRVAASAASAHEGQLQALRDEFREFVLLPLPEAFR